MHKNNTIGILVMAYGGPDSLEDVPAYLADIRKGRPTPQSIIDEITENYRKIGGKSPLLELTQAQVAAVKRHFDPAQYRFYLGMRHWKPWIEDTVGEMVSDGIRRAVSIVMAPHYSKLSIAKYQEKIASGLTAHRGQIEFAHVESYHDAPGLITALANRVQDGLARWPRAERAGVHVVFSAHSLPERILQMGDPYDAQLRETARLVADQARLSPDRWTWSYQSAGRSSEPWLGPQIQDHLVELSKRGIRNVVSVPVGFVSDHVEILYDIDILAQTVARAHGVRLERPPSLNTDPLFIKAVAGAIQEALQEAGWVREAVDP